MSAKSSLLICFLCAVFFNQAVSAQNLGIFDAQTDVGNVKLTGSALYEPGSQQYKVTGSGYNIWFDHDAFHYVYKRIKGDFILTTSAAFLGKGVEMHR